MNAFSAVPFTLKRSSDLWDARGGYESTTETAHGLAEADRLAPPARHAVGPGEADVPAESPPGES